MLSATSDPGPSPELDLLLCCARVQLAPHHVVRIQALVRGGIDWDRFLGMAERHRMLPLVHRHLSAIDCGAIPKPVLEDLEHAFTMNAGYVLGLAAELLRLLNRFRSRGIPVVPYKGPVLAVQLYGNLAFRHAGDLDIIVQKENVPAARDLLLACGYRPRLPLTPAAEEFQLRGRKSEVFERDTMGVVELHWAFTDDYFAFPLDFRALAARLEYIPLCGESVPVFSREDLLLILCVHGWKHCWDRLEWICGVAELLRGADSIDWVRILERARKLGSWRMLLLGLGLAHELLEAPLPRGVVQAIRSEPRMTRMIEGVERILADGGEDTRLLARDLFRYRLVETLRDRLRFLAFRITTPDPSGWVLLPLGSRIIPLHSLIYPFRRTAKAGVRMVRRLLPSAGSVRS